MNSKDKLTKVNWLSSIPLKYKEEIIERVNREAEKAGEQVNNFASEVHSTYQVILNIKS